MIFNKSKEMLWGLVGAAGLLTALIGGYEASTTYFATADAVAAVAEDLAHVHRLLRA